MKRKLNQAGFTLIELLAVITIMGILMMVAIPSVSRVIENSRRDTFMNTAKSYLNQVRNEVLADNIACGGTDASALGEGTYYFPISTGSEFGGGTYKQQTIDLMEKGGKSAWGNGDVYGYIVWKKTSSGSQMKTSYYAALWDKNNHGLLNVQTGGYNSSNIYGAVAEDSITRSKVSPKLASKPGSVTVSSGMTLCTLK